MGIESILIGGLIGGAPPVLFVGLQHPLSTVILSGYVTLAIENDS